MAEHTQELFLIEWIAFNIFTPPVLAVLATVLAAIHVCNATRNKQPRPRGKWGKLTNAANWAIFALAFLAFSFVPLETWRAMLRISVALFMISKLAYLLYDIEYAMKQVGIWLKSHLRIGSPMHLQ